MTGVLQVVAGNASAPPGVVPSFQRWQVIGQAAAGITSTASLTFRADGSVTYTASPTDQTAPGTPQWYAPVGGTPGNAFWIRATNTGNALSGGDVVGSWLALSANRTWTMSKTTTINTATLKIEIATDAAGTNIVFTSTGNTVSSDHLA
jgi:hypothetical protein